MQSFSILCNLQMFKIMLQKKIYTVFFLIFVFLSGCSDKPITVDDIVGIGDDISEVFGRDDSDTVSYTHLTLPTKA